MAPSPSASLGRGLRAPPHPRRAKHPPRAHHDWVSLSVPPGAQHLLVENLQPDTSYQFSVLAQNKLGSGPFSQIVTSVPRGKSRVPRSPPKTPPKLPFPPRSPSPAARASVPFLPRLPSDHSASGATGHDRARLPVPAAGPERQRDVAGGPAALGAPGPALGGAERLRPGAAAGQGRLGGAGALHPRHGEPGAGARAHQGAVLRGRGGVGGLCGDAGRRG